MMWVEWVGSLQKTGKAVDAFDFYEGAVKSKGKADMLGQFYTPMAICDCMAEMIDEEPKENVITILDCAVGSGRTLLGHANANIKHKRPNVCYYIGGDIDQQSVKMCTLNLAINGLLGRVLCADGLQLQYYGGYEINEVKYPFWTDAISIRRLPEPQGFTNIDDIQRECNYWNSVSEDKKQFMEALYQCRIGNPKPCIDLIPSNQSELSKVIAEMQIVMQSKTMAKHYGYDTKQETKKELKQEPKKEVKPIEAPIKYVDTRQMVQKSLFD